MSKYRIIEMGGQFYWEKHIFLWDWYRGMWGYSTIEKATEAARSDAGFDRKGKVVADLGRLP